MADLQSRIIIHNEGFDASGLSNENTIARARLEKPDVLTSMITMMMGAWDYGDGFPLLGLTEGQIGGSKEIENIEYQYPFIGKRKTTTKVMSTQYGAGDKPGLNNSKFFITFEEKWFPPQSTISCGQYGVAARIMAEPTPAAGGGYRYECQSTNPDKTSSISLLALQPGVLWGLTGGSTVTNSLSIGNWSTTQTPGYRKNQISILRKSYHLAGNIANRMVEFRLANKKANTTSSLWLDYEEFQHMLTWKAAKEEHLWLSEYNRDEFGNIVMIDNENQLPIPVGAGLKQQIPNVSTYAVLTEKLIRDIVTGTMQGTPDTKKMDIVLYCGSGFADGFDQAMKGSVLFSQVAQGVGNNFVQSMGGNLMLGGYFTSYKSVDGHIITLKKLPLLDFGGYADASGIHPVSGRPRSSYEAFFVDQSTYDGQKNIQLVHQKGRMELRGLHQGMTALADTDYTSYRGNAAIRLATERDASSVHFMATLGVQMLRDTNSFRLELSSAV
jgi:hypothetical protein